MPIYEFQCIKCEAVIEHFCSFKDKPKELTHFCGGGGSGHPAEPIVSSIGHFRIAIDGAGRKGFVTHIGGGKKTVRSATRERYEHLAGSMPAKDFKAMGRDVSKSQYTRSYERHCKDKGIKERKS